MGCTDGSPVAVEICQRQVSLSQATTGCPSAEIPRLLLDNKLDEAYKVASWYRDVFGKDNYFVEIQNHPIDFIPDLTRKLVDLSRRLDIPLVATKIGRAHV